MSSSKPVEYHSGDASRHNVSQLFLGKVGIYMNLWTEHGPKNKKWHLTTTQLSSFIGTGQQAQCLQIFSYSNETRVKTLVQALAFKLCYKTDCLCSVLSKAMFVIYHICHMTVIWLCYGWLWLSLGHSLVILALLTIYSEYIQHPGAMAHSQPGRGPTVQHILQHTWAFSYSFTTTTITSSFWTVEENWL